MHSFISNVSVDEGEVLSDHFPVTFNCLLPIKTYTSKPNEVKFSRKLSSIDIELFKLDLKLALAHNFPNDGSFNDLYSAFTSCLSKSIDDHAPLRTCKVAYRQRPKWMDNDYVKARAHRRKLEKRFRRTQNEDDRLLYVQQRSLCSALADNKRTEYYKHSIAENFGNQKALFQIVDHLLGGQVNSVSLPESTDHKKLADEFNEFFINKVDLIHDSIDNSEKAIILNDNVFSSSYYAAEHCNFMLHNNIHNLNVAEQSSFMLYHNEYDLNAAEHSNFMLYNKFHDLNVAEHSNFMLYYNDHD